MIMGLGCTVAPAQC